MKEMESADLLAEQDDPIVGSPTRLHFKHGPSFISLFNGSDL
jgi:hypothetical protein